MKTLFALFLSLPLMLFGESTAVEDAQKWLAIVDKGDYKESWQKGSLTMRLKLPEGFWISYLDNNRKPLGAVVKRELVQNVAAKDPENLPKGDYLTLLYVTDFSKEKQVKEILMLVQESDGTWRTLSYLVTKG